LDKDGKVLYVGKANDLKSRVSSYFAKSANLLEKTKLLVSKVHRIKVTIVESELEALLLEAFYIKKLRPKYNVRLADDKSYAMIRISIKDPYPAVTLARSNPKTKPEENSLFFGPYPDSRSVKLVLRTIRKVFPFQSVPNHPKKICLYHHLGLCPCPPVFDSKEQIKQYRKNIRGIIKILEGKSRTVLKELEKKRDALSRKEMYEEADVIQKRINALRIITEPRRMPFEYHLNPNLRSDIRQNELNELMSTLSKHGLKIESLKRIECYDISNTQGIYATGSMVVFTNGEKDTSEYRRFRIKRENTPNDFAMMEEVLTRRFRREGWQMPSLIIVDGGKGQVSASLKALSVNGISIPLIGLAKREEAIILPGGNISSPFSEILLAKNSEALHLIMRIRDEAHRFAITYHKLLRSKNALAA
jgi:excinuclease ABC subunit C